MSVVLDYDKSTTVRSLLKQSGIARFLSTPGITEVKVSRPGEIWTESRAGWQCHTAPDCSLDMAKRLANTLVNFNKGKGPLTEQDPIKSVELPDGQRGQVVIPPACEPNTVSLTIRIASADRYSIDDLDGFGAFKGYRDVSTHKTVPAGVELESFELDMMAAKAVGDIKRFFEVAVLKGMNIILVGGTGSGKTTLMKALADLVPHDTCIGTIEDTHELSLPYHQNRTHLFYSDALPAKEVVKSTLRMKFDRVYLSELRGDEAWDYLTLLNTGHEGGMSTVHANNCISALTRIATLIKQSPVGLTLDWNYLLAEVKRTIDVVAFMDKKTKRMTQLHFDPVEKWRLQRGLA
ncbi:P-type DNA transfer ATPase VirB11 [Ralstonia pseudosolanacearum]|uniref:P-type DNA transfer ATPase VirB11 n=1 Tax=Ralstonia pseudosolanacearum TaxID=1310165 RepID=UPI002004E733|nr:P-type DNA transfer ATPase VirB11 [Ralstonia pseudosolanacearum]MCK4140081.1 P-type DNA transfer ATPase VirB11 [Ralstonia pseudosolanacearum]